MNRWALILAAATAGAALVAAAHAQGPLVAPLLEWTDPALRGPTSNDEITKKLEDAGRKIASYQDQGVRAVYFDYFYPAAAVEYEALGANGIILISAVAHDAKEFPLKRVYLRFGGKDVVLQPISGRQSTLPPTSSLVKTIGAHRDDEFFLLPGSLAGRRATLLIDFGANENRYPVGDLQLALPGGVQAEAGASSTPPRPAALQAMLAREYPELVKP